MGVCDESELRSKRTVRGEQEETAIYSSQESRLRKKGARVSVDGEMACEHIAHSLRGPASNDNDLDWLV